MDVKSKFLEKDDVGLRPIEKEDKEFLQRLVQHPEVRDTIGRDPRPVNLVQEENHIESLDGEEKESFLIMYDGEKAGSISIGDLDKAYRKSEFGISVHPDYHNQGVGAKATELIVKYAFETLNRHRLKGGYLEGNEASRRVMEKAGFTEEGRGRDFKYVNGEWKDVIWMSILEDEYFSKEGK